MAKINFYFELLIRIVKIIFHIRGEGNRNCIVDVLRRRGHEHSYILLGIAIQTPVVFHASKDQTVLAAERLFLE